MSAEAASALHEEGVALADVGDEAGAMTKYMAALALDMNRPDTLYNVGLIHKYRGAWAESLRYNRRALALRPDDEASNWNLAIAATALRDWTTARSCWHRLGMPIALGADPIQQNFGSTPIRINPDGAAEVVWARRICPVRARLQSIPLPESGYAWGDEVLHDGAPMGTRYDTNGNERSVFNALQLFEPSVFSTYVVVLEAQSPADVAALEVLLADSQGCLEDWTASVRNMCRACSEGRAHDAHDHEGGAQAWQTERRIGIAARRDDEVAVALEAWRGDSRLVLDWTNALSR